MNKIFEGQRELMQAFGIEVGEEGGLTSPHVLSAAIGMSCEASEVLDLLNKASRPWKPKDIERSQVLEESVDILFYIVELFVLLGLSAHHLEELYLNKLAVNFARILAAAENEDIDLAMQAARGGDISQTRKKRLASEIVAATYLMNHGYIAETFYMVDEDIAFMNNPVKVVRRINEVRSK